MALKDFRVKNGLTVESGDITLTSGNINFSNGYMQTDNIKIDGNTISSTDSNGNINVTPNGTGYVMIDGVRWPNALGANGKFLQTNGSGHLSWVTVATAVVEDTTPQLGGQLDAVTNKITNLGTPTANTDAATKAYVDSSNVFIETAQTLSTNKTISSNVNAVCAGPMAIASSVTLTIGSNSKLLVLN